MMYAASPPASAPQSRTKGIEMEATSPASPASPDSQGGLASSLHHMIDETDQLLRSAAASGDQKFQVVREKMVEQMRQMRVQLNELEAVGRQKAREAARMTDETVHAHPYGAMAVAAAAGMLIGFLAARR
jgi:ElaB/YqjD/DUF883 family membrane-anchored ribosome-binding protein